MDNVEEPFIEQRDEGALNATGEVGCHGARHVAISSSGVPVVRNKNNVWGFTKRSAVALISWQKKRSAEKRVAKQEAKKAEQKAAFASAFEFLKQHKNVINPASWRAVESYAEAVNHDSGALGSFAAHPLVKDLMKYAEARQNFLQKDEERQRRTQVFNVSCDTFFSAIGYSTVTPILQNLVRKYRVSNAGNVIAAGVFSARRNTGGVAYSVVESARVGAHNGDVSAAFLNHMTHLSYSRFGADLSDLQRRYIIYAYRLLFLNRGDKAIVARALFSLIYDNGNAAPKPPVLNNKFSQNLHAEFHNNFLPYLWTVAQAAAHLDNIRQSENRWEKLFQDQDVGPFLRTWKDEVPAPGFHLKA